MSEQGALWVSLSSRWLVGTGTKSKAPEKKGHPLPSWQFCLGNTSWWINHCTMLTENKFPLWDQSKSRRPKVLTRGKVNRRERTKARDKRWRRRKKATAGLNKDFELSEQEVANGKEEVHVLGWQLVIPQKPLWPPAPFCSVSVLFLWNSIGIEMQREGKGWQSFRIRTFRRLLPPCPHLLPLAHWRVWPELTESGYYSESPICQPELWVGTIFHGNGSLYSKGPCLDLFHWRIAE
jgi:hypothetical protein